VTRVCVWSSQNAQAVKVRNTCVCCTSVVCVLFIHLFSSGFGEYSSASITIPCWFKGVPGRFVHSFYVDNDGPIAAGREVFGLPSILAEPKLSVERDVLVGSLRIGSTDVIQACKTMILISSTLID
jgi:acetoacetate decarboxylase